MLSVQPSITASQDPLSIFALGSKLNASSSVQPKTNASQEPSSVWALGLKLNAVLSVHPYTTAIHKAPLKSVLALGS